MKIVFCDNSLVSLIKFRGEVIKFFLDKNDDVILVYPKITETDDIDDVFKTRCKRFALNMLPSGINPVRDVRYMWELYRVYKSEKPDVVFNYTIKPNIYSTLMAALSGVKNRVSVVAGLGYVFSGDGFVKKMARRLYKFSLLHSSRVIVLNQENYNLLQENDYVKADKIILFEGGEGVDLEKFKFASNSFEEYHFLMIARVLYDKGYSEFVQAAEMVKKKYPNAVFELLGAMDLTSPMGVAKQQLDNDVKAGYISYLGETKDVYSILSRNGVVVVLPSYHEGMNRSLMEACAVGRPIITSNIPGCKELVDDGKNGFLVEPKNATDLADKILKFIDLDKEGQHNMCSYSREKAQTIFDMKLVFEKYVQILKEFSFSKSK